MQKVVVTGGAGFIGSEVVRALAANGYQSVVFDIATSSGDILDKEALRAVMQDADAVVHLAALISVPDSIKDPERTKQVNVMGTENVFAAAQFKGVKRIVYASSAAVYGDAALPNQEDMSLSPQSPYAESKIENEQAAITLAALGLRFFNVYGPGQRVDSGYAAVIPKFIALAKAGKPLTITGDGTQTRDFVHVRDVARAVVLALESNATGVCNIASGTETPLKDLVELIRVKYPVEVEMLPAREGDILRSVASISRAKELLGWSPTISFADGINELLS